jgi:hypothetical protein
MKTAMQKWFDELKANYPYMANEIFDKGFNKYLEKEKQQIIHAFNCGESFSVDYFNPETPEVAPSVNYFIQSYQNK